MSGDKRELYLVVMVLIQPAEIVWNKKKQVKIIKQAMVGGLAGRTATRRSGALCDKTTITNWSRLGSVFLIVHWTKFLRNIALLFWKYGLIVRQRIPFTGGRYSFRKAVLATLTFSFRSIVFKERINLKHMLHVN